ncbi:MAG: flagellar filament capping protein FliD [Thermodesulfobacteriota bacterium]
MAGTSMVSGLASGLDWQKIIEQLRAVEHKRIDLIESRKKTYTDKLSAWQAINTKLLSLKTTAGKLNKPAYFNLYTVSLSSNTTTDAEDILSATTTTSAAPGSYQIKVNSLASAQKLSSTSFASQTAALNLSGDIIIGGRTVSISTTDSLSSIRHKINAVNSGANASQVTASIVNYGNEGYRLILTSDEEGSAGISLLNGGATDLLGLLGFVDAAEKTAKNIIAAGHKSDAFSEADEAIGGANLLNLTSPQSGEVTIVINGISRSVAIDLATDSLNTIREAINNAFNGVFTSNPASVISETAEDGNTFYRLLIEGSTIAYTDTNNILETLGILKRGGVSDEKGVTGDIQNTIGGVYITSATLIKDIDGYNDYAVGDTIELTGTDTSGNAVSYSFVINDTTTVGELLTAIENQYGYVTAQVTADGKIRVLDNELGDTDLSVILTPSKSTIKFDSDYDLGALSTIRARQIQAGANASITIDGVEVTASSNMVDDVIPGVTLNLKKAASDTTVTLNINRDYAAVKEKIEEFVNAYNEAIEAINSHLRYNETTKEPGGILFGDNTLKTIKSSLTQIILNRIAGVSDNFSTLGQFGIRLSNDGKLSIEEDTLNDYLASNFDDLKRLFVADWSATNSNLTYIYHTIDTQAGTYNIQITGIDPVTGYFETEGDAQGEGEYLRGISGNAKGLVLRYSGTATGDIGSFTLTYGVAELLDRALYYITDSVSGTIANKEQTIQETISSLADDISEMEDRLDRKMADLERKFIAMETALSTLQSQISWLSSQIETINKGWG